MKRKSSVRKLCIAAICVALCYILPLIFHATGGGELFSPMHFPVLLCGVICGPIYGVICAILGPILSSILSSMPPVPKLITMLPELITYALVSGIMFKFIRTKSLTADIYISLVPAMVAGRIIGGIAKALTFMAKAEGYSMALWAGSYFVGTLPGIISQLILIPILVVALIKTRTIDDPYAKAELK